MNDKLNDFIDHARDKGMDLASIRQLLLSAGWRDQAIAESICARELELSIPKPTIPVRVASQHPVSIRHKSRDAFLHLLAYATLYLWSMSVVLLLFTYLDFAFPDSAWRISYNQRQTLLSTVRVQLAVVTVAFPVFLVCWHYLLREVKRTPTSGRGVLRRWLGNFSLFVGVITLSVNAMTLVFFWLEGQMTIRFVLKVVCLFMIAGCLVGYLAWTLRSEAQRWAGLETHQ